MTKDSLGDRMKSYENQFRNLLERKRWNVLRIDGKAFHTYTRNLNKPFDSGLIRAFEIACIATFPEIQGSVLVYTQSDEASFVFNDLQNENSELWFNGNIQKIVSVASSIFTFAFNDCYRNHRPAYFDARVFQLPDGVEVMNYLRWRNLDCFKNAVAAIAQSQFSSKELIGKSTKDRILMLENIGQPLNRYLYTELYGQILYKDQGVLKYLRGWDFMKDEGELLKIIEERV